MAPLPSHGPARLLGHLLLSHCYSVEICAYLEPTLPSLFNGLSFRQPDHVRPMFEDDILETLCGLLPQGRGGRLCFCLMVGGLKCDPVGNCLGKLLGSLSLKKTGTLASKLTKHGCVPC